MYLLHLAKSSICEHPHTASARSRDFCYCEEIHLGQQHRGCGISHKQSLVMEFLYVMF